MGFYILDGIQYPCVEYLLSKESSGYSYPLYGLDEDGDGVFSLSRKYIVVSKGRDEFDYIYLDSQYEMRNDHIMRGRRRGFLIREDDDNYDYDSVNEIHVYDPKYNMPWDVLTHGKMTRKYDVNAWNWEYAGEIIEGSDFDEFFEEPTLYNDDYACMSFKWDLMKPPDMENAFGKFARYDQLEMDTIQIIW